MKIALRGGHSPNCKGANVLRDEQSCMWALADEVEKVLTSHGHTVVRCETTLSNEREDVRQGAKKGYNCDMFISLHMNASDGRGNGAEAWVARSARSSIKEIASRLCKNYATLGLQNRGVKEKDYWEMTDTNCPNIIFETMFCDNKHDIDIWASTSWDKLARLIANAIDPNIPLEKEQDYYRVAVQRFKSKEDAEKAKQRISGELGYYCFTEKI